MKLLNQKGFRKGHSKSLIVERFEYQMLKCYQTTKIGIEQKIIYQRTALQNNANRRTGKHQNKLIMSKNTS